MEFGSQLRGLFLPYHLGFKLHHSKGWSPGFWPKCMVLCKTPKHEKLQRVRFPIVQMTRAEKKLPRLRAPDADISCRSLLSSSSSLFVVHFDFAFAAGDPLSELVVALTFGIMVLLLSCSLFFCHLVDCIAVLMDTHTHSVQLVPHSSMWHWLAASRQSKAIRTPFSTLLCIAAPAWWRVLVWKEWGCVRHPWRGAAADVRASAIWVENGSVDAAFETVEKGWFREQSNHADVWQSIGRWILSVC